MRLAVPALVGVLSDTHGTLHPRIPEVFRGVDAIVHAGDVGGPQLIVELEAIAPVLVARGNTDVGAWADELPVLAHLRIGEVRAVIVHRLTPDAPPPGARVVISGHTHRPLIEHRAGALYLNPGSASDARVAGVGETVALLRVTQDGPNARIVIL